MMNKDNMLTIDQVAQLMKVSKDTIRRRVREGEYVAEKHVGPYGEQWYLPESQFDQARIIQEVVPMTRSVAVSELQATLQLALSEVVTQAVQEETGKLMEEIKSLKEQLATAQSNGESHYRLVDERLRQLTEARQQEQAQEQPRSFWQRLFG
ncbi:helix-turn-helix domain-containing protein [Anaeromusa acidaminophila]|uniref:helix-turn-helix domain-containing protein n=1 Tax=Anaeromusa acidaminophila TaxID=81464 RepID=UPI00036307CA|nr:helix-turn-helix domain-containing protein [Anaeromusa acidaminophila]